MMLVTWQNHTLIICKVVMLDGLDDQKRTWQNHTLIICKVVKLEGLDLIT